MTVNGSPAGAAQTLTFSNTGAVTAPPNGNVTFGGFTPTDGARAMNMAFNFGQTTQYGTQFGVTSIIQNGYTTGQLSTVSIDPTGVVSAVYTNGRTTQLGQLAIANFPNPQGLQQLGNTNWAQTFSSGTVVQGTAGFRRVRQHSVRRSGKLERGSDHRAGEHDHRAAGLPGQRAGHHHRRPDVADRDRHRHQWIEVSMWR